MTSVPEVEEQARYVFISYARGDTYDAHLAKKLYAGLRARRVAAFRDENSIELGDVWPDELQKALARATHFVVILSAEAAVSTWVNREIETALTRPRRELQIVGIRRSKSAEFTKLADIQVRQCAFGEELRTVYRTLALPLSVEGDSEAAGGGEATLCDRTEVVELFHDRYPYFLRSRPGEPQAHFIVGRPDEQHQSLVQRLAGTFFEQEAAALATEGVSRVVTRTIKWPQQWTLEHDRETLVAKVFDAFFDRYSLGPHPDLSAGAFARAVQKLPPSIEAVVHEISRKVWKKETPKLLEEYLRFWAEAGRADGGRRFFLFFNVEVCHARPEEEEEPDCAKCRPVYEVLQELERLSLPPKERGGIAATLVKLAPPFLRPRPKVSAVPSSLLALHCVERLDVERWFRARTEYFRHRETVCTELFANGNCQPMSTVEQALLDLEIAHQRQEAS